MCLAVAISLPFLLLVDFSSLFCFIFSTDPIGCCCPLCVTRFQIPDCRYRNAIIWDSFSWILPVLREIWDRSERLIRAFYTPDRCWSFSFHHFVYSGPDLCRMHSLWRFSEKLKRICLVDIMFGSTTLLLSFYSVPMMIYFQGEFVERFVMFLRRSTEARPNLNLIIALQCIKILALIQYQKIRLVFVSIFFSFRLVLFCCPSNMPIMPNSGWLSYGDMHFRCSSEVRSTLETV